MSIWDDVAQDMAANGISRTGFFGGVWAYVTHPGCAVVMRYRVYSRLHRRGGAWKVLAKLLWLKNTRMGCYLDPTADIAPGLRLPHAVGVVIGGGAVVRESVTLYQNTTIGRISQDNPSLPTIGAGSVLYAGATAIGPINLTAGSIIGAFSIVKPEKP